MKPEVCNCKSPSPTNNCFTVIVLLKLATESEIFCFDGVVMAYTFVRNHRPFSQLQVSTIVTHCCKFM